MHFPRETTMLPMTAGRVPLHTDDEINQRIRRQTEQNISHFTAAGPTAIDSRLAELDREWDIERTLEANAATVSLIGLGLGFVVHRRFLVLPVIVAGFLLQHALQGWCPPLPIFRRFGVRTQTEIDDERCALKAARGDFQDISASDAKWSFQEHGHGQ
jgi:hypothetical protein